MKNEFTLEQKIEVVEKSLERYKEFVYIYDNIGKEAALALQKPMGFFLCNLIEYYSDNNLKNFSEFLKYKPKDLLVKGVWFGSYEDGKEKRKEVLEQLLKELKSMQNEI